MKKRSVLLLSVLLFVFEAKTVSADVLPINKVIVKPNVIVSATIGIPKMTIWGYGPPNSSIELLGVGVDQMVTSDESGYYSFDLVYLPNNSTFPELCITAIDQNSIATPPTCIPPIGAGDYFYNVGPVILPPTISIGTPQTNPGGQVSAQGTTIPNSEIEIKLAYPDVNGTSFSFQLVKNVLATYVPSYTVSSDVKGNYSFNMPTTTGRTWRLFAITDYEDGGRSPKSNTLKFETLTTSTYIWKSILAFLASLLVWPRVIILELLLIILIIVILIIVFMKKGKHQKTSKIVERYQNFLKLPKIN